MKTLPQEIALAYCQASSDSLVIVGEDGKIVGVNEATETMFGYAREELIGGSLEMLLPERHRAAHLEHRAVFNELPSARPMGAQRTFAARRKDGSEVPVVVALTPLGHEGRALVCAQVRSCSFQAELEEHLRHAVEQLEASRLELKAERDNLWKLATNSFAALGEACVSASGIEFKYLGEDKPEIKMGLSPGTAPMNMETQFAMMYSGDHKRYQDALDHSLETGEPFNVVYRLDNGKGHWRWLEARAVSVEVRGGRHVRWVFCTRDLTEQKEAEEGLLRSLDELQRLKSQLQVENTVSSGRGRTERCV